MLFFLTYEVVNSNLSAIDKPSVFRRIITTIIFCPLSHIVKCLHLSGGYDSDDTTPEEEKNNENEIIRRRAEECEGRGPWRQIG